MDASLGIPEWRPKAKVSGIRQLHAMTQTLLRHAKAVLSYYKTGLTSRKMEGSTEKSAACSPAPSASVTVISSNCVRQMGSKLALMPTERTASHTRSNRARRSKRHELDQPGGKVLLLMRKAWASRLRRCAGEIEGPPDAELNVRLRRRDDDLRSPRPVCGVVRVNSAHGDRPAPRNLLRPACSPPNP
jgi:hypothetical protein